MNPDSYLCFPERSLLFALLVCVASPATAADDRFDFGGTATGVIQAGVFDHAVDAAGRTIGDTTRGSLAVDLHGSMAVGTSGTAFAKGSFAEGNGLDGVGGVSVRVNADDLEDDVKDINGTGRDYLLEAWYAHRFELRDSVGLELTGGIIDATRYIDKNRAANDEIHQFMNEVFVNRFFLPSYDPGVALSVTASGWTGHAVWMNARADGQDGHTYDFHFYGADVGRRYELPIGEGNLRLIGLTTSNSFVGGNSRVHGVGFSMGQSWGEHVILFARGGGFSDEEAVLVHDSLYSAGVQLSGHLSPRSEWIGGIAYAFLDGAGNAAGDVRDTRVWEAYLRWTRGGPFDASLDVQHVTDELYGDSNPTLLAVGVRINYSF